MRYLKHILALSLTAALMLSLTSLTFTAQAASEEVTGELKLLSYNVDGLPIPESLSSSGRNAKKSTQQMAQYINEYSPDIFAVQEDFNYHSILKKSVDLPYRTYTTGGVPFGDGLNFFSKLPIYNVSRVTWNESCGILTDGSDELTPKGILYGVFEISKGIYIDVYTIHTDGYEDDGSISARLAQYHQLISLINEQSAGKPVVILGDFNTRMCREYQKMREIFIEQEDFRDAWSEICFEGKYPVWESEIDFNRYVDDWSWWGKIDSVDRVMYRNGGGISLEAVVHEYEFFTDDSGASLSDHAATKVTLKYTVDANYSETREMKAEQYKPVSLFFRDISCFFKALRLLLSQLPQLISGEISIGWK